MEREAELDRELERRSELDYRERLLRERDWERERERGGFLRDRPRDRDWDRRPRYAREPLGLQMDRDDHEKAELDWYAPAPTTFTTCCLLCLTCDVAANLLTSSQTVHDLCLCSHCPNDASTWGNAGERSGQEGLWSLAIRMVSLTRR